MDKKNNKGIFIIVLVSLLLIVAVIIRVIYLSQSNFFEYLLYKDPHISSECVRGEIVDRNEKILALDTPLYGIEIIKNINKEKTIEALTNIMHTTEDDIRKRILDGENFFSFNFIPSDDYLDYIKAYIDTHGVSNTLELRVKNNRKYIGNAKNAFLGTSSSPYTGNGGIEELCNATLRALPKKDESVSKGENITLTIDDEVQKILEDLSDYSSLILILNSKDEIVALQNYDESFPLETIVYEKGKKYNINEKYRENSIAISELYYVYIEESDKTEELVTRLKEELRKNGIIS